MLISSLPTLDVFLAIELLILIMPMFVWVLSPRSLTVPSTSYKLGVLYQNAVLILGIASLLTYEKVGWDGVALFTFGTLPISLLWIVVSLVLGIKASYRARLGKEVPWKYAIYTSFLLAVVSLSLVIYAVLSTYF